MAIKYKLSLYWDEYEKLAAHIHTTEERSVISSKWKGWVTAIKDFTAEKTYTPPNFEKLSQLSAEIQSRLEDWAILCSCVYTRNLKHLQLKLTFSTENVMETNYQYCDDRNLMLHLGLQLAPAYDIIKRYLQTDEALVRTMRPLEMQRPFRINELKHLEVFNQYYRQDLDTKEDCRVGLPFAVSVFTTYGPFEF